MKLLEGSGSTKQRAAVLQVIRDSKDHPTANEVFERSRKLLPGISFATVYNSLRYLKNEGLIGEVNFDGDAARYDRKLERHDHAVCSSCGKLTDLELNIPPALFRKATEISQFDTQSIEIVLRGLCPECKNNKNNRT